MPTCLEVKNLTKQYRGNSSLSLDIDKLEIQSEEIFGILGPNGAGKTTLISILCGILDATAGLYSYQVGDKTLTGKDIKKHIGYVPQDFAFFEELSPLENLHFFGAMYGLDKNEINAKSIDILVTLGLENVQHKKVSTFSGGMKRRVNLAIGVLNQPQILFLDEPTVGVDVQSKRAIFNFLTAENKKGVTIIYSSQNMKDVEEFCAQIALIDHGKIIEHGKLSDILKDENTESLEEYFLSKTGNTYRAV